MALHHDPAHLWLGPDILVQPEEVIWIVFLFDRDQPVIARPIGLAHHGITFLLHTWEVKIAAAIRELLDGSQKAAHPG